MGLYFDDLTDPAPTTSRGRTITETDVVMFAGLTGDYVELHTNEEFARQSPYGRRIAHGALVFSVSVGLTTQMGLITDAILAFAGVDKLRFVGPVFIGDTVHVVKRVIDRRPLGPDRGLVVFESKVVNQRGETVLIYHDKLLLKTRPAPTA